MSSTSKPVDLKAVSDKERLKSALVVAIGFGLIALLLRWRGYPTGMAVALCLGLALSIGIALPAPIGPAVYAGWMRFAHVLGRINTTIILSVLFFVIMTPLGLVFRLLGRDALALKLDRDAATYWAPKARPAGSQSYFNQF